MSRCGRFALGAGLALAFAQPAAALEYCVTCEGPPAMYRCVIAGTPDGPGKSDSSSLMCISEMAARGGHEKCAVSRGAPYPCPGLTASIKQPAGMPAEQPAARAPGNEPPRVEAPVSPEPVGPDAPAAAAPAPAKVPRTVEELAKETVKSSKAGIDKAGEAIGGTAKKAGEQIGNAGSAIGSAAANTWTCISSFFSNCGGETNPEPAPGAAPPSGPPEGEQPPH
jgi:hypothetical protein